MKRAALLALSALAAISAACGSKPSAGAPVGVSDKPGIVAPSGPVQFVFDSLDERPVSSAAMQGKPTVIAFVTTGDLTGQAQVDYLVAMAKNDKDRVNYVLIALHPRREIVLVDSYVKALNVEFPVARGDPSSIAAGGPFGEIPAVPTIVILDRAGRIAWKHTGLAKSEELRSHMHGL